MNDDPTSELGRQAYEAASSCWLIACRTADALTAASGGACIGAASGGTAKPELRCKGFAAFGSGSHRVPVTWVSDNREAGDPHGKQ